MNIRHISRASTAGFVVIVLCLLGISFWGANKLRQPYLLQETFTLVYEQIEEQVSQPMYLYLRTSNTVLLTDIEVSLGQINERWISELPREMGDKLQPVIADWQSFVQTDLRAAGKLGSDMHAILDNNQRQFQNELATLADYVNIGKDNNPRAADKYAYLVSQLKHLLISRMLLEQRFLRTLLAEDKDKLLAVNGEMLILARSAEDWPLLDVFPEKAVDDMDSLFAFSDDDDREDLGEEIRSNVRSFLVVYPKDLETTLGLFQRRAATNNEAHVLMTRLRDTLKEGRKYLKAFQNETLDLIGWVIAGSLILLFGLALILNFIQRHIAKVVNQVAPALRDYAGGDFRQEVKVHSYVSELKELANSCSAIKHSLSELILAIQHRAKTIDRLSQEITISANAVSTKANQQQQQTQVISVSTDELSTSFLHVAENANEMADVTNFANETIVSESKRVYDTVEQIDKLVANVERSGVSMQSLNEESDNVTSVLMVIEEVAEQTNLLALNAAIEAARAGEAGRGFAVVADEVRMLSQRTAESTHEIKRMLARFQTVAEETFSLTSKQVKEARGTSEQAALAHNALSEILKSIERIKQMNDLVASAIEEQSAAVNEIASGVTSISQASESVAGASQHTTELSARLRKVSGELTESSEQFRLC
ncbi:MAG: methyl-accepting chemotaxis protein [Pseudomonadales bacterium]|nr:methyl-accepting chemotaxis protein [Pseudomonadales bacterium]